MGRHDVQTKKMKRKIMRDRRRSASKETVADKIGIDYENVSAADIMRQIKEETAKKDGPGSSQAADLPEGGGSKAMKSFMRTVLLKSARPFRPLIKLLIHDPHQDLMAETYERLRRLEEEHGEDRKKEYIKLLYGLSHNIVVELTKLKIEVEDLRVKLSILEKDFENFKKREKALERHVFK